VVHLYAVGQGGLPSLDLGVPVLHTPCVADGACQTSRPCCVLSNKKSYQILTSVLNGRQYCEHCPAVRPAMQAITKSAFTYMHCFTQA
jgi:hypothetical protein